MRTNRGNILYGMALCMFISMKIFDESMFSIMPVFVKVSQILKLVSTTLLIWKIIVEDRFEPTQVVVYGIVSCFSCYLAYVSKDKLFINLCLFWIGIQNVKFKDVLKWSLIATGITLGVILLSVWSGLVTDRIFDVYGRARRGMGFAFPTTSANHVMYFMAAYIAYRGQKIRLVEIAGLFLVNLLFYIATDTKSCFAVAAAGTFLIIVLKMWNGVCGRCIAKWLMQGSGALGAISAVALTWSYEKSEYVKNVLNPLVSGRLSLGSAAWSKYGIKPFGQYIEFVGGDLDYIVGAHINSYNYVDSSYMQIMLLYGAVALLLLIAAFCCVGGMFAAHRMWYSGIGLIMVLLHATFDPQLIWLYYNIFLVAIGYLLIVDKQKRIRLLIGERKG